MTKQLHDVLVQLSVEEHLALSATGRIEALVAQGLEPDVIVEQLRAEMRAEEAAVHAEQAKRDGTLSRLSLAEREQLARLGMGHRVQALAAEGFESAIAVELLRAEMRAEQAAVQVERDKRREQPDDVRPLGHARDEARTDEQREVKPVPRDEFCTVDSPGSVPDENGNGRSGD